MIIRKSFVKSGAMLLCLLILAFSSPSAVNGQKRQLPDKRGDTADDYVIIEGDIQVSPSFYQELVEASRWPQAAPIKYASELWPNGMVPFEFDDNVTPAHQSFTRDAMDILAAVANVHFRQCNNNKCGPINYVHFQNSDENSSRVGMKGGGGSPKFPTAGKQTIKIHDWDFPFVIVHELMHCLGFFHEHSRPDRGNYVRINCNNVKGGCGGDNFSVNLAIEGDARSYGDYDFDSVMHYKRCAFSSNTACPNITPEFPDGGVTIQVLPPYDTEWQFRIGNTDHISALDVMGVSFLYPFPDWRFLDSSYTGGSSNGSFHRPYTTFAQAVANTPAGGTIWLLKSQTIPAVGTYDKQIKVKAAPGVIATLE